MPIGAIQEVTILTNAFSSEYGWTSGPALNIVTKSGTTQCTVKDCSWSGQAVTGRQRHSQRRTFVRHQDDLCYPTTLQAINPVDIPDAATILASIGVIVSDKTFFFATADYTRQNRTTSAVDFALLCVTCGRLFDSPAITVRFCLTATIISSPQIRL